MNTEKLEQLFSLKEKGVITEEEFQSQKELLLKENLAGAAPKISMVEAYKSYWQHSFKWQGRATRSEYWWPVLVNFLIALGLSMVGVFMPIVNIAYLLFCLVSIFPVLSVWVRRYHDLGHSAWFAFIPHFVILGGILIAMIDFVMNYATQQAVVKNSFMVFWTVFGFMFFIFLIIGVVWGYVFPCLKGQSKPNKYGDPR